MYYREYEQPLNPPGWDAPDRQIKRQYIPMREYDDIKANGYAFSTVAEVEACGARDQDLRVDCYSDVIAYHGDDSSEVFAGFLDSYISRTGPTWRELIESEICRQASLLPCTAWEVEYEGE